MNAPNKPMGQPLDRVDGLLKVTGRARYAGEYPEEGLLHGSVVSGTVARGRVVRIDASRALALPGVVAVIDHTNRPKIASYDEPYQDADAADGSPFRPLYNDQVLYSGQPLALVVAENLELARYAGSLIEIEYEAQDHQTDLTILQNEAHPAPAELPKPRGNFQGEYASSAINVDVSYRPLWNITTRWSPTPAPCCINLMAACTSMTRPRARKTARPTYKKCSGLRKNRCAYSPRLSAVPSAPG